MNWNSQAYGIREKRTTDVAGSLPRMTIQSWIEYLPKLTTGYELRDI